MWHKSQGSYAIFSARVPFAEGQETLTPYDPSFYGISAVIFLLIWKVEVLEIVFIKSSKFCKKRPDHYMVP